MISKSFLKSSIIYTIGGALPMLSSIILLPFYTNLLSEKQYVSLSFYIGISILLQIFFSYSVDSYFGVKYTQLSDSNNDQKKFTGTISILLLYIGLALTLLSLIAGPYLFPLIFSPEDEVYFWPFGLASIITAFFNSYFKTCTNALIYFKAPLQFFIYNIINFVATIAISLIGLYMYPNSLIGPISGRLFSGLIIFVTALIVLYKNSIWKFTKEYLPEIKQFCTPFILYVIFSWILTNLDRYFLKSNISSESLASYDVLLKCFFGIEFLQNSLSAILFPKLFAIWKKNNSNETTTESNRYYNVFTVINIFALLLFCILIPPFLEIFIHKQNYYESFSIIGIVAAGYATRSILNYYMSTILYSKKTWVMVKVFGCSSIVQVIVTYFFVLQFGLIGAIYAGIITKLSQVFFSYLFTKKVFTYNLNYLKIYGLPLLYMIINIALYQLQPSFKFSNYLIQIAIFSLIFYFVFKNEIKLVFHQYFLKPRN